MGICALYKEEHLDDKISRSLNSILVANVFMSLNNIICGSGTSAMVGLATSLGADDLAFGIISAVVQVAAVLQIPFSILVSRTQKRKKYMMTIGLAGRTVWLIFGFIPMLIPQTPPSLQLWTVIFLLGVAATGNSMINVCWFPWFSDLMPLSIRSRWLAIRNVILSVSNVVVGIVVTFLLDYLPPDIKYIIIFLIGGALGIIDVTRYRNCEEVYVAPSGNKKVSEVFREIFRNKPFMNSLAMWTLYSFAVNMGDVYRMPYAMNVMGLSYMQMMIFATIAASVATILFSSRWGKAIFNFGEKNVMFVAGIGASLMPLFYLLAVPGNIWPVFLYHFISGIFLGGTNIVALNLQLANSPNETRPSYVAVYACITSVLGVTLGSLAGGFVLDGLKTANVFIGFFDRYKFLFTIEVILRIFCILFMVPKLSSESEKKPMDLIRSIYRSITKVR